MHRMSLHLRLQHGALLAGVGGVLVTGLFPGSSFSAGGLAHVIAGFGVLIVLFYHGLYVAVRAYVESQGWGSFPMRWESADAGAVAAGLRHLVGTAAAPPAEGDFRVSQKALYWWSVVALAGGCASGVALEFWESVGFIGAFGSLSTLAAVHRGLALLLVAALLWHLYGAMVWEGQWSPEWSWVTGNLDAEKARSKLSGAWRRHLKEQAEREASGRDQGEEGRTRERQLHEREEVQTELEKGNSLALEEKFVEALYHYRRALELYPGYSQARYNMARVLTRMGEREMALEAYREFIDGDPFHPLARKAQEAIRELEREAAG